MIHATLITLRSRTGAPLDGLIDDLHLWITTEPSFETVDILHEVGSSEADVLVISDQEHLNSIAADIETIDRIRSAIFLFEVDAVLPA